MTLSLKIRRLAACLRDRTPVLLAYGQRRDLRERQCALDTLLAAAADNYNAHAGVSVAGIIFSKDRAMQLHALVRSYIRHVVEPRPALTVIYRASSEAHATAYREVAEIFSNNSHGVQLAFVDEGETGFRQTLLQVLENMAVSRIFFLVDDIIFIRSVDFAPLENFDIRAVVPSLRLGDHISYSYTSNQTFAAPCLTEVQDSLLRWSWAAGQGTWGYPMSVDGNIFCRKEMFAMAQAFEFCGPNSFESGLVRMFGPILRLRDGICFKTARLVNIPWNRVQREIDNRYGAVTQAEMLSRWQAGECIDIEGLDGMTANAVHVEVEVRYLKKDITWGNGATEDTAAILISDAYTPSTL